jgi:hypothetical protein
VNRPRLTLVVLAALAVAVGFYASCSHGSNGGCDAGSALCGNQCVGTQTDPNNCGACGTVCRGPCDAGQCSPFNSVSPGDLWEGETHLAVGTNGYVAVAWIASTDSNWEQNGATSYIAAAFSSDRGATWTPVQTLSAAAPDNRYAYDPVVAVDAANNFYLAFGGANFTGQPALAKTGIWVSTAPKGTTTFGTPVEVSDPAESSSADGGPALYYHDKPWIAVTKNQEIVVAYARLEWATCSGPGPWTTCVSNIILSRSADAQTWTRVQATSNSAGSGPDGGTPDFVNWSYLCASISTSRLWLLHSDEPGGGVGGVGLTLRFSDDDGATWNPANVAVVSPPNQRGTEEQSCAGDGNDVWVAHELHAAGASALSFASSIQVVHSSNGGQTFGAPVNALDTGTSQLGYHSTLVLESSGALDVAYFGGKGNGDIAAGVYSVRSTDQGATWGSAMPLRKPVTFYDHRNSGWNDGWLGDYLGVTAVGGSLYTSFTDNSSGVAHVDFAKVALP